MTEVRIDNQGRIVLPEKVAEELAGRSLQMLLLAGQHLLLTGAQGGEEVVLAGQLGEVCVTDLLSFLNMFRKSGVLRFSLRGGTKEIFFDQGEVVSAGSTFAEEDLGEVLCELGKLTRDQLASLDFKTAKLGAMAKHLVERGVVSPKDLWHAARYQVETIIFNLFSHHRGSFSFAHAPDRKAPMVRLSMSTQNLIMEGLRRVDERALFMRRLGTLDGIPVLLREPEQGLSSLQQRMVELITDGRQKASDLLRSLGFGEFEGIKCLCQLVEKGLVGIENPRSPVIAGTLGAILDLYNEALSELYRKVVEFNPAFHQDVEMFLRDLPQPFSYVFRGVYLRDDGGMEGARIFANLEGLEEGDKEKLLADALDELVYMESLTARQCLTAEVFAEFITRVHMATDRAKKILRRSA